jgi:glycosyltransferase involved in cell wall biosynthesis
VGWNTGEIFDTLAAVDLGDRIRRIGYVASHDELPAFYSAADAFVFPTFYEGFGLPLLEALTCGCPVVTSDNSSVPEAVGGAAVCVDARDIDGIAAGIVRVIEDGPFRESMIARGLEHARTFSWEACAATTLEVYRRLAR